MFQKIACVAVLLAIAIDPVSSQQPPLSQVEVEYAKQVHSLILKQPRYPAAAKSKKVEGRAIVGFQVAPDGRIKSRRILESSGHSILDQEALEAVDRANPLPPFPPELKKRQTGFNFTVPIRFQWRQKLFGLF